MQSRKVKGKILRESEFNILCLKFNEESNYKDAANHFARNSNFEPDIFNDRKMQFDWKYKDDDECEYIKSGVKTELKQIGMTDINHEFYFLKNGQFTESTNKTKRLIQRIVEHVIKKKLNENTKVVLFDLTVYPMRHHDPNQPSKIKISKGEKIEIIEHPFKNQPNDSLIKYKGKEWVAVKSSLDISVGLKESIRPKRRLKEAYSEFIDLQDFESHIHDNIDDILDNMKTYGFTLKKIKNIRNYYDLSSLTDIDSNQLRDVELYTYANAAYDLIKQEMDDRAERF